MHHRGAEALQHPMREYNTLKTSNEDGKRGKQTCFHFIMGGHAPFAWAHLFIKAVVFVHFWNSEQSCQWEYTWNSEAQKAEVFLSELFSGRINIWIVHEWIAANHHFTSLRESALLSAMFFTLPWKSALVSGIMGLSSQRKNFLQICSKGWSVALGFGQPGTENRKRKLQHSSYTYMWHVWHVP